MSVSNLQPSRFLPSQFRRNASQSANDLFKSLQASLSRLSPTKPAGSSPPASSAPSSPPQTKTKAAEPVAPAPQAPSEAEAPASAADKEAANRRKLSWIPPQGAMKAREGSLEYWIEWKRGKKTADGWKITGYVYIFAKGKPQPASKIALDARSSQITRDGRLIAYRPNPTPRPPTRLDGVQRVQDTASGKVYYELHSIYGRILGDRRQKHFFRFDKKWAPVTLASTDLFLFLLKHKKHVTAKSALGEWLRANIGKLMKAKDLGAVPQTVRLAVVSSGLSLRLFGVRTTETMQPMALSTSTFVDRIGLVNMSLDRILLGRLRNAFRSRLNVTEPELNEALAAFNRDMTNRTRNGVMLNGHPLFDLGRELAEIFGAPGNLTDEGLNDFEEVQLRLLLERMIVTAQNGGDVAATHGGQLRRILEDVIGPGGRTNAIIDALLALNVLNPRRLRGAAMIQLSDLLNQNRDRLEANFEQARVAAARYLGDRYFGRS